jgi:4'-phosphopantetheinyl transferase
MRIATGCFAEDEIRLLNNTPPHKQRIRFYQLWTLKEAYIKAKGMGLSIPLEHCSFANDANKPLTIHHPSYNGDCTHDWQFWQFKPDDSYILSLAAKRFLDHSTHSILIREIVPMSHFHVVDYAQYDRFTRPMFT